VALMTLKLHLLGGSGRIGRALVDSLVAQPLANVSSIQIYCDSTKVADFHADYSTSTSPRVKASGYSAFNTISASNKSDLEDLDVNKHIVLNLRGINNKQQWLNQPLDSLEFHYKSCRAVVDADLWMQPGTEIIHLSSLLCDLIEGPRSLDDICEGQESYRRPYVVSRLHQEMILSANAYQHSICTSFLRMPAVYGLEDDHLSPWVLNSLCKGKLRGQRVEPRHPDRIVYLSHRDPLLVWIRALIGGSANQRKKRTVNYLRPPMLRLSVSALATLVKESPRMMSLSEAERLQITLEGDTELADSNLDSHLSLLTTSISELLVDH
jgi:nucleoside-diphosphate-sugar epimerase